MNMTVKVPSEVELDAIKMSLAVHYEEDIPNDFPLRIRDSWVATVDINTGIIREWPPMAGKAGPRRLAMKVTDCGSYYLMTKDKIVAKRESDYVPDCIPGKYGDYVDFTIDPNGKIVEWSRFCTPENVRASFFPDDDCE